MSQVLCQQIAIIKNKISNGLYFVCAYIINYGNNYNNFCLIILHKQVKTKVCLYTGNMKWGIMNLKVLY